MTLSNIKILLVSANVGSLFQNSVLAESWMKEVTTLIEQEDPFFIALHCQEWGGKISGTSTEKLSQFIHDLCGREVMKRYKSSCILLDEDISSDEQFTALASLYFIKDTTFDVSLYNFEMKIFQPFSGHVLHSGNISAVPIKQKWKFAKHEFPHSMWSRKGVMKTRWNLQGDVVEFVNLHLFHDSDNLLAIQKFPSEYGHYRREALHKIINELSHSQTHPSVPFFLFGDFNFRINMRGLIQNLLGKDVKNEEERNDKGTLKRLVFSYPPSHPKNNAFVGTKEFFLPAPLEETFIQKHKQFRQLDGEADHFLQNHLINELPVTFPPSYPFSEEPEECLTYMRTRCPSWCDRIFMSADAMKLFVCNADSLHHSTSTKASYNILGLQTCIGDHKPVYLSASIKCRPSPDSKKM